MTNRRQLLGLAAALLATPFLPSQTREAKAEGPRPPLRLLTLVDSYGLPNDRRGETWISSSVGDYALESQHLGTVLAPLAGYLQNMLVVSGVDMSSLSQTSSGPTHDNMTGHALTGSRGTGSGSQHRKLHASLDHRIGTYLNDEYGLERPRVFPHLFLSNYAEPTKTSYCYDTEGLPISAIAGVSNIADTIFGSGGLALLDNAIHANNLTLIRSRVSELQETVRNLDAGQSLKTYQGSVDALAKELEIRAATQCEVPDVAAIANKSPEAIGPILDLVHKAFACDLASSITYSFGGSTIDQMNYRSLYDAATHNDAALLALLKKNLHASSHRADEVAQKVHELVRTFHMFSLSNLLDKLAATPDIDGTSTLLDNTVVFVHSTMSFNTHKRSNYPTLIVAGQNTGLQGGFHYDCSGQTNNDVMSTLVRSFDAQTTGFGGHNQQGNYLAALNNGPIEKMLRGDVG